MKINDTNFFDINYIDTEDDMNNLSNLDDRFTTSHDFRRRAKSGYER